jgi:hypothetical protein
MDLELFGPQKRARVTQEVTSAGHWSGSVQGLRIRFDLLPLKDGRRVAWSVQSAAWSRKGVAGTVFEALDDIRGHVARREAERPQPSAQDSLF